MTDHQMKTDASTQEIALGFIHLLSESHSLWDLLSEIGTLMRRWSGCEAVGIRLKEGDDFPYFETKGFPAAFVRAENYLCSRDCAGRIERNSTGNPVLECMCGNVIEGRFDSTLPFFTENGSFWTNSTTDLLASTSEADRQARTRNRCNGEGYESVALVPIRYADTRIGLLQFNDSRRDRFEKSDIEFFEKLASSLSITFLQKLTLEELQDSEEQLRLALDGAGAENFEIHFKKRTVSVNNKWRRFLGYEQDEFPRDLDELKQLMHSDDLVKNKEKLEEHIVNKTPFFEIENRVRKADGTYAWLLIRGKAVISANELRPTRILGITFDITERKKVEQQLRRTASMWDATFNSLEESLFVLDGRGVIRECNNSAVQVLEKSKEEICGHHCCEKICRQREPFSDCPFKRAIVNRKVEYAQVSLKDRYFEARVDPVFSESGKVTGAVYMLKDITERKSAIEALELNRYYLTKAQEIGAIGTWDLDIQNDMLKWTDENYLIFGVPLGTPLNYEVFLNCVHPDDRDYVDREWKAAIEGASYDIEHRLIVNGEVKWIREKADISRDEQGRGLHAIGVSQDITTRKLAEQEREQLQTELLQAHKMESVGRLAGGVAHDFNNMLGVILGHTEMALEEQDVPKEVEKHLSEIQKAARRSSDLTRQLLAFARKQTITPKIIDMNEKVASILNMLMRLIGEEISLEWKPGRGIWPVKMDPTQLDQVLANLCVNARDAIRGVGTIEIQARNVTLTLESCIEHPVFAPGDYVLISVSDTGCGMDRMTLSHLFEPFFTTKRRGEGTGLGLATVYGIVSQNHGFITVDSKVGVGTTFEVYLPRCQMRTISSVPPNIPVVHSIANETVLLVEDESALLVLSAKMLESFGYNVITAASPSEAIRLAEAHDGQIDLLLTDVIMPEMNGRDLARRIVAMYPNVKRLFMSGYTANVIADRGILEPGVSFVQKPFRKRELLEKVQEVLSLDLNGNGALRD